MYFIFMYLHLKQIFIMSKPPYDINFYSWNPLWKLSAYV
jgi:hypothetical protein